MPAATVTDATFDDVVLGSTRPVVVDFWAPWCAPCKQLAPMLDQLHEAYGDVIGVVTVNTDQEPLLGRQFAVTSLPTVIVFSGGAPVMRLSGVTPKYVLLRELEPWLP